LQAIVQEVRPNLSLAPANLRLSYLEPQLITRIGRENVLKKALDPALSSYDVVLIDCPPSLGIFTVNAFAASDEVLIPMAAEFFALVGVSLLLDSLSLVRSGLNHDVGVLGIVPTRVTRTAHAREVIDQAKSQLGEHYRFFDPIPEAVAVRDASAAGVPVAEYQPTNPAAKAYHELAKEILA
jgi:chromosome partitioning protein